MNNIIENKNAQSFCYFDNEIKFKKDKAMKTLENNSENSNNFFLVEDNTWITKITIAIFFIILNICVLTAQTHTPVRSLKMGGGIQFLSSGNAHGAFYLPFVSFNYGTHSLLVGAMTHKSSGLTRGGRIIYSKNLSGQEQYRGGDYPTPVPDRLQLNFYSYAQYTNNIPLSQSVEKTEQMIKRENSVDWTKVKLTTVEAGAGIEFRINISKVLCIRNTIGAGVYNHLTYVKGMDHEKMAPTLNLSTGIHFTIQ